MTKTDFFRVIIKLFGVYCFVQALFNLFPNISFSGGFYSFTLGVNLIYLLITGLIAYFFLFQTDILVKFFRLEKGFDNEKIETKDLNARGILKFGIIFIGLLMVADNLAQFLNFTYLTFKKQVSANGLDQLEGLMLDQQLDYNWWIISGLNVIIGIIMLTNYKRIASMLAKK